MLLRKNIISDYDLYLKQYYASVSLEHRQKYGQFFTPYPVAKFMAKWVLNNHCQTILDPAFGLGIFAAAILEQADVKIFGFEKDHVIYNHVSKLFQHNSVIIKNDDYIHNDWNNQYDGVICNPPYFKFHNYDNQEKLQEIKQRLSINLASFSNLYTLFLLKAIDQLKENGRAAFLLPSEFMNADYGKSIKDWLIHNKLIEYIIILDFRANFFNDALTTSCILLLSKNSSNHNLQFLTIHNDQQLETIEKQISQKSEPILDQKIYRYSDIKPERKWRIYYQGQNSLKYQNLVPFSHYAQIVRGIATGDNDYFTFSRSKQLEYQIKTEYLLPCITKANHVNSPFFDQENLGRLINEDKKIFLLNINKIQDESINQYLLMGEKQGVNNKYLTSHRKPWYKIENRSPAPIWVNVFNRKGLRFIRNEVNIHNLTTFHCVYPNLLIMNRLDLFFAYLITPVAQEIFNDNRREYAQGLNKFEPNDLNNSLVVNFDMISNQEEENIVNILAHYRQSIFDNDPGASNEYLDCLNQYFLEILHR